MGKILGDTQNKKKKKNTFLFIYKNYINKCKECGEHSKNMIFLWVFFFLFSLFFVSLKQNLIKRNKYINNIIVCEMKKNFLMLLIIIIFSIFYERRMLYAGFHGF